MADKEQSSIYDLLRGKLYFTNEKPWFRLVIYLSTIIFWVGIVLALKEWIIPALTAKKIFGLRFESLLHLFKGRSP